MKRFLNIILFLPILTCIGSPVRSALGVKGTFYNGGNVLPYDAEVEYLEIGRESKSTFYIDLPGGDYPGLGLYAKCTVVKEISGDNTSLIGIPNGKIFTDWIVATLYGTTGFTFDSQDGDVVEWYCMDDGTRQTSWVKRNGIVGQSYAPIDRAREDIAPVEYFRLIGASNNQSRFKPVKIEIIQIFNYDKFLYDFIPVRFTNELGLSEGAMYDRANPTVGMNPDGSARTDGLYRNRGTGAFIIGPDK